MYRYISNILFLMLSVQAYGQKDTVDVNAISAIEPNQKQLRLGVDLSRPVMNMLVKSRHSYEFIVDYSLPKEM